MVVGERPDSAAPSGHVCKVHKTSGKSQGWEKGEMEVKNDQLGLLGISGGFKSEQSVSRVCGVV